MCAECHLLFMFTTTTLGKHKGEGQSEHWGIRDFFSFLWPSIYSRHGRGVVVVICTPLLDEVSVTLSLLKFEHVLSVEKCKWRGSWVLRLKLVKPRLINDLRLTINFCHILTIVGTVLVLTKPQLNAFAMPEFCTGQITTWSIRAQWSLYVPPDWTFCPHRECSDVLVGSQNKQRLFPCTDLIHRGL